MISAIILAAGLSKRMSLGNKLLLKKNNIPIINITINKIKASKVNEIILVLGNDSQLIHENLDVKNIKIIVNKNFKEGISSSIKKGIKNVNFKSKGALICLGDMPLIRTSTYNEIIQSFCAEKKNIIPFYKNKRGNPIIFTKSYYKNLMEISGDEGAKKFIKEYPNDFTKISLSDEGVLKDIDDKNQYYGFTKK